MKNLYAFIAKHNVLFVTILVLFLLPVIGDNFKLFTFVSFIFLGIYFVATKSALFSLAAMLFLTQHFLSPGKYYTFTLIEAGVLRSEPYYSNGIIDGYGLLTSDLFAASIGMYLIYVVSKPLSALWKERLKNSVTTLYSKFLLLCWTLYFSATLFSSLFISFHPVFSIINTLQFSKIIIFYIAFTILLSRAGRVQLQQIGTVIGCFSVGNALVGVMQFLGDIQDSFLIGRSAEFFSSVEHEIRISAPKGFYLHSNEFALFSFIWGMLLIYFYLRTKNKLFLAATALSFVAVLLSQSRTVWLIGFLVFFIHVRQNTSLIQIFFRGARAKLYSILLLISITVLTIPRIAALQYTAENGSLSVRQDMIRQGSEIFHMNPWTGYGAHTGVHVMYEYIPGGYIQDFPFEIHNAYLQIALESGIVGTVAFFFPFLILIRKSTRSASLKYTDKKIWFYPFLLEAMLVYYMIQPHSGRLGIPLLGVVFAFVTTLHYGYQKTSTKNAD